jgi:hypothetical protein
VAIEDGHRNDLVLGADLGLSRYGERKLSSQRRLPGAEGINSSSFHPRSSGMVRKKMASCGKRLEMCRVRFHSDTVSALSDCIHALCFLYTHVHHPPSTSSMNDSSSKSLPDFVLQTSPSRTVPSALASLRCAKRSLMSCGQECGRIVGDSQAQPESSMSEWE